ncbi:hypothetical protein PAGU2196_23200 [Pseudomonas sp. PAGU 2196]|uniref:hypothetical protein n=1 Tax=Pseudomonas sp. PAGU 2196 TaxID=2793997 RepID=UPI001EDD3858|nr:hypothetical protein [Pseudomonas sp. PAGU 2196]GHS81486.1 hypothetical protein PAGU2196_23200 [Pseudomonas sp. PAGU 2196]
MSDFETEDAFDLGAKVAELTDSVGVLDDASPDTAVPNALADEVEDYAEHAQRRDEHLAEQPGDDVDEGEQVEQQPQGKRQQHVPLGALQEERQRRQAAQAEAEQLRQQIAQFQAQQQAWQAQQQQLAAQQAEAEIPAFVDDPEAHVNARLQQIEQAQQQEQARRQYEAGVQQVDYEVAQIGQHMQGVEAEFRAQHSDYDAATAFITQELDARIAQQHPGATPYQLAQCRKIAVATFYRDTVASGQNFAQLVYDKARELGFQTQARTPRKAAPTSLSTLPASGRAPDQRGALSASQVSQMSAEQFDAFWREMEANSVQQPWG